MNASVRPALEEARRRLDEMYGERLARMVLYGSHARDDAREDSDVDVLVILRDDFDVFVELKLLVDIKLELLEQYDVYMSFQPFTEADYRQRQSPLMINARAEGIEL